MLSISTHKAKHIKTKFEVKHMVFGTPDDLRYLDLEIQTSGLIKDVPLSEEKTITSGAAKLEDFPELVHHIQSLLPLPDAVRTCILSKSWARAWSTIPNLRFLKPFISQKKEKIYYNQIDHTLLRYHQDNIPIQSFILLYNVRNKKLAFLAEKWIQLVSPKTCLKELSLVIRVGIDSFTLPDEILYGQHLITLSVTKRENSTNSLCICNSNALIKCVSLRVLELVHVNISEQVLNNLLSTCCLLEKIKLDCCGGFKTIKCKNLCFLRELKIITIEEDDFLEIDGVPGLHMFDYSSISLSWKRPLPFNLDAIRHVRHLNIAGVFMGDSFFDTIKVKFPFLESLTIGIAFPGEESFVITSASLKWLTIRVWVKRSMDVQVYAPKLLTVNFEGWNIVPRISFPTTAPDQVKLTVN